MMSANQLMKDLKSDSPRIQLLALIFLNKFYDPQTFQGCNQAVFLLATQVQKEKIVTSQAIQVLAQIGATN